MDFDKKKFFPPNFSYAVKDLARHFGIFKELPISFTSMTTHERKVSQDFAPTKIYDWNLQNFEQANYLSNLEYAQRPSIEIPSYIEKRATSTYISQPRCKTTNHSNRIKDEKDSVLFQVNIKNNDINTNQPKDRYIASTRFASSNIKKRPKLNKGRIRIGNGFKTRL